MEKNAYFDNDNFYLKKHNLLFLNIPKVASTSLWLLSLQSQGIHQIPDSNKLRRFRQDYIKTSLLHKHPTINKIAFVRNPFSRLVSVYKDKIEGNNQRFVSENNLNRSMSFEDFVDFVLKEEDHNCDKHIRSQFTFLFDHLGRAVPDYVGRLENFKNDLSEVAQMYHLPIENIPKLNTTKTDDYKSYYSDSLKEKVNQRYSLDLELLNYKFSDIQKTHDPLFKNIVLSNEQHIQILKYKSQKLLRIVKLKEKYDQLPNGPLKLFRRKYREKFTSYFQEDLEP